MTLNNTGDASRLAHDGRGVLTLLVDYLKLEATDKLSVATNFLILFGILFALATSAIFFLSTGLVKSLSGIIGSEAGAYYVVGGLLVIVMLIVYLKRKDWIERPVVRNISQSMLKQDENEEEASL
ncbi:MAG: phage holin family protein [Bacteroidaceae bacterium]|nr:phage holin family protein [Bacteroidaceae bacterium]